MLFYEEDTIRPDNLLDVLKNIVFPSWELGNRIWFPSWMVHLLTGDSSCAPFCRSEFTNRWSGRDGSHHVSGHNSTCLFCGALWIYTLTVNDIDELKHQINEAFTRHVRNDMLDNTWWELYSRLQMLQANGGSHIEVYELLTVLFIRNDLLYCYVFCNSQYLK